MRSYSSALADSSDTPPSVHFVALPDREPLPLQHQQLSASSSSLSSSPSLRRTDGAAFQTSPILSSYCGSPRRAARCSVIVLLLLGLLAGAVVANWLIKPDRSDDTSAACSLWVTAWHMVPDAVQACPQANSSLTFDGQVVPISSAVHTNLTRRPPQLRVWPLQPQHLYGLLMLDIDFPSATNTSYRSRLHLLVLDIPPPPQQSQPLNLSLGLTLFPYTRPCPEIGTGEHRYVVLLYDTVTAVNRSRLANVTIPPVRVQADDLLSLIFMQDLSGSLMGGTFFTASFDDFFC